MIENEQHSEHYTPLAPLGGKGSGKRGCSISQIATLIGAHQIGDADIDIQWLLTDSRSLCFPESTLFFAIRTPRGDGHKYIRDLYDRGVRAFVVEASVEDSKNSSPRGGWEGVSGAVFLQVESPLVALQRLAERHRENYDIPVIGITGSNGKTTVKEWLYQMLSPDMTVTRSPRSYNSQIGVPLSVWGLWEKSQIGIFEAAISQPGEMDALQRIIQPTIGVFTGLGQAHQENFQSMEEKLAEKMKLFKDCKVVFGLPETSPNLPEVEDPIEHDKVLCAEVCRYLGMPEETIQERLAKLEPVAMRLEVKQGRHGCIIINDSYNSDLNSLDIALDFMNRRPERENSQRVLVLSDILQSGVPPKMFYDHVAELIQSRGVERFIGVGPQISAHKDCFNGLKAECLFFETTDQLLSDLTVVYTATFPNPSQGGEYSDTSVLGKRQTKVTTNSSPWGRSGGVLVLIKGARVFRFDHITDALEQKVHETILEVNLKAVVDNLNYYRSFLRPETKIVCMVKADAYGAGAIEVAKTLQTQQQVGYLAVAVADEGALLRSNGITKPIMIMNPEMTSFNTLFEYNLEPEVYSFRILDALVSAAERAGITGMPVHIKLDTGMHRLGFDPEREMPELIDRLKHQSAIIPRSVFSHFVGSDSDGFDEFSAEQYRRYLVGADALQAAFSHHIIRHMDNSAGIEHFPERQMDMVRLGLGLYGINSRDNEFIHSVSTLRTTILQIHDVPASETVGYSRRGQLKRNSRIAAIPIGYADGWDRHFGNGNAYCLVNGHKAPYVGNICMDVCMIDVTDIPCQEGDMVTLFGEELSPSLLAERIGTIPYEILTSVAPRVKKVYYQE